MNLAQLLRLRVAFNFILASIHLRMEILRALNQPLVWGNDGGRKHFIYLDFVSVICKEYACENAARAQELNYSDFFPLQREQV